MNTASSRTAWAAITLAALGYFVDIYDLVLFGVVRVDSLSTLGVSGDELAVQGHRLLDLQMLGMLVGGIFWGILGDKRGRLSVLFGSILMYSAANVANGLITNMDQYALLRFIAGVGLAGELGAGITLVSELMPAHSRGYGAMIIATFGALGAVFAGLTASYAWNMGLENWRVAYFIGGGMGLLLLLLRIGVMESGMFARMKEAGVSQGNFALLFRNRTTALRYLYCILVGVPIWYGVGILVYFSTEFAPLMQVQGTVTNSQAILFCYIGLSSGDLGNGLLTQLLKSRKKAITIFLLALCVVVGLFFSLQGISTTVYYALCFGIGFSSGYWAVFVLNASEQFGTNIRATATTTVPNFVRGSVALLSVASLYLAKATGSRQQGALIVGCVVLALALFATWKLKETYGKELDYVEA